MATAAISGRRVQVLDTRSQNCEKHGEYSSRQEAIGDWFKEWTPCPKCAEEREEQARQHAEQRRIKEEKELADARFKRINIPARFRYSCFEDYRADIDQQRRVLQAVRDYTENFPENFKLGRCLVMMGKPGCGKTLLACAMANELTVKRYRVLYTTASALIRTIRNTWRRDSGGSTETDVLADIRQQDLLILDEIGVQFGSEAEMVQLTEALDLRYQDMKPTLVISNCDKAGMVRFLGERAVDRLRENGGQVLVFDWESWRGQNPEDQ